MELKPWSAQRRPSQDDTEVGMRYLIAPLPCSMQSNVLLSTIL